MRKEILVATGALFLAGAASADILLYDIDADPQAWADALANNGKVAKGGWDFGRDPDYGIVGFDGPLTSVGGGPVSAGNLPDNTIMNTVNVATNNLVAVGPSFGFGNGSNFVGANYFTDSFEISFTSGDKTAVEFVATSLLGSNTVDISVNGVLLAAGAAAPASGRHYGIIVKNDPGTVINSVNLFDAGGGAEGVQGQGTVYVPAPGALALLGVAGLVARRRRR